jgi:hypothetical protein
LPEKLHLELGDALIDFATRGGEGGGRCHMALLSLSRIRFKASQDTCQGRQQQFSVSKE